MLIRAVDKRCGVVLEDLRLPLSEGRVLQLLTDAGFQVVPVSLVELARGRIGVSLFERKVRAGQAPDKVDCSSFVKWLYGQKGVWIPRRTIQQWEIGQPMDLDRIAAGDLVFTKGRHTFYTDDVGNQIGHVGMATGQGSVIHASNAREGVIEASLEVFCSKTGYVGVRRIAPLDRVLTLRVPDYRDVETSDDLRWMILSSQTRK